MHRGHIRARVVGGGAVLILKRNSLHFNCNKEAVRKGVVYNFTSLDNDPTLQNLT